MTEEQQPIDPNAWSMIAEGMQRMVKGREQMTDAADKAVEMALASMKAPKYNPTPRGPAGKALSARAQRRAMGQTRCNTKVTLVGVTYFDGGTELIASTRAPKRVSGARKKAR